MTKPSPLAARAKTAAERKPRPTTVTQPPASVRTKSIRLTFDLAPQDHRTLTRYCANLADDLGQSRVPASQVIRALLRQLAENPTLQDDIRNAVNADIRNAVTP